ncbi:hypothetical protein ASF69_13800 [Rhizobium sp. Leaf311]|nr:hypothetical protein ASF69_13800 [Rhizobium sp. Leaf311]
MSITNFETGTVFRRIKPSRAPLGNLKLSLQLAGQDEIRCEDGIRMYRRAKINDARSASLESEIDKEARKAILFSLVATVLSLMEKGSTTIPSSA